MIFSELVIDLFDHWNNKSGGEQMKKKIAVESQLSNVKDYLAQKGYDVLEFQHNKGSKATFQGIDAVVISGMDQNYLGMHDIKTEAVVIEASGMTPQQIMDSIEQRV